tara:strand:+ start:253 stop:567 length:315 start_codon:yes stop_codon:yes gene_type:complete
MAHIGEHGEEITISMEEAMNNVRRSRDFMLETYVDYYQSKPLLWNSLTDEQREELVEYRQALLDWPERIQEIYGEVPPNSYAKYQPYQPSWFENHPRGIMFPHP